MKDYFLLSCALLFISMITAQQFTISGTVSDSTSGQKLLSATVFLESVEDSTLITYSITDMDGKFLLTGNTNYQKLNFFTSFQGYKEYSTVIDLANGRTIDLGNLSLNNDIKALGDIVVSARRAPITVKRDTLEFNAKSFNTQADATLEDVIKQLPGVELDKDGKIKVNGKEVTKILVNGKEFFGNDPQIALKNLPKEIIDKIQVTESKTEEQKQSGDSGDDNASEINITIDEDKNKGLFSRFTASGGTDDRYSLSGIVNYFNEDFRISVLGSSNNINSPGFSFDEIYDAMGSSAYSITRSSNGSFGINGLNFGSNGGITSSRSAGLNVTNEFSEKFEVDGNYFYGSSSNIDATDSRRTTFLPDRSFTTSSSSRSNSDGDNLRFGSRITIKPDTLTTISIRPGGTISSNFGSSNRTSASVDENGDLINDLTSSNFTDADTRNLSSSFYVSRRLKTKGSYLSLSANVFDDSNDSRSLFNSVRNTFGNNASTEIQNQRIEQNTQTINYRFNPTYRQTLNESIRAKVEYTYDNRDQTSRRGVFNVGQTTGDGIFDPSLSNDFNVLSEQHRPEIGFDYEKNDLRIELGTGYIYQTLESDDALQQVSFDKEFKNIALQANIRQKLGKFGRVSLDYSNRVNVPNVRQLQPVADRTDPTNIIVGNPDLDATVNHQIYLNVSNYNWETDQGFYMGGSINFNQDAVTAITTTDENLIRTTSYTNVDGNRDGYLYADYTKSWKKDQREIGGSISFNGNYNRSLAFTNGTQFESIATSITPGLRFEYSIIDQFDIDINYDIDLNNTSYDIASIQDQEFVNHTVAIDLTSFWPENFTTGLRGEYNRFGNVSSEFDNDSFVLIGSLGYKFAGDKAIVKVTAYDILDQVISTRRVATQDYVLDTSNLVLQQYFLASFTYKFSKFGGKDPNRE